MVAAAALWFLSFFLLVGTSSDSAHEAAGMALGKAIICGVAAAVWFYRARKSSGFNPEESAANPRDRGLEAISMAIPQTPVPSSIIPEAPPEESTPPTGPEKDAVGRAETDSAKNNGPEWWVFLGGFVILCVFLTIGAFTNSRRAGSSSSGGSQNTPPELVTEKAVCPSGLPAGAQTIEIKDLKAFTGSQGELLNKGAAEVSNLLNNRHDFSFTIANEGPTVAPGEYTMAYCLTEIEVEADIQESDKSVRMTGKADLSGLGPGMKQAVIVTLGSPEPAWGGELLHWEITKVWGFPLHP